MNEDIGNLTPLDKDRHVAWKYSVNFELSSSLWQQGYVVSDSSKVPNGL
jgi:hypothetical protein